MATVKISRRESSKYFNGLQKNFMPNNEKCPDYSGNYVVLDRADFLTCPDGSMFMLSGNNPGASYVLRVDQTLEGKKASIWRNIYDNGLIGPASKIISISGEYAEYKGQSREIIDVIEEGAAILNHRMMMPIFNYDTSKPSPKPTMDPDTCWDDYWFEIKMRV